MLVSFELSMPGNNSWNGRWSGEGRLYARVVNVGSSKKAREKYEKLIGHHSYNFGDGWRASVTVREVTSSAARKLRKDTAGFCGYDWMIHSLRDWGEILAEPPSQLQRACDGK
jgi:hypothetical protein